MALATTGALPTLAPFARADRFAAPRPTARTIPAARLVAATDAGTMAAALLLAFAARTGDGWLSAVATLLSSRIHAYDAALLAVMPAAAYLVFDRAGLYDATRVRRRLEECGRAVLAGTMLAAVAAAVIASSHSGVLDGPTTLRLWTALVAAAVSARAIRGLVTRSAVDRRRVVIVGSGPHARRICRELSVDPRARYEVLGFVDTSDGPRSRYVARRTLGSFDTLEAMLAAEHVDEVHVGLPVKSHYRQIEDTIRVCERIGVKVMYGATIFGTALARPRVSSMGSAARVELQVVPEGWTVAVKRAIDIVGAAAGLVLLSPLLIATALAVRLTGPGPVLFAQERYGLNRRRFRMLKFRTMVPDAERLQAALEAQNEASGPVFKIRHDPRITPLGRWLRRTSIDELPQLLNVLRGDMSLVGPRPLPVRDVRQITNRADMRRFSVRPGITGLWQVSGRSALGFDRWIALDLHYIDHWSLPLDAAILARTIPAVVRGTGAS